MCSASLDLIIDLIRFVDLISTVSAGFWRLRAKTNARASHWMELDRVAAAKQLTSQSQAILVFGSPVLPSICSLLLSFSRILHGSQRL